jgi:hypothetical protein
MAVTDNWPSSLPEPNYPSNETLIKRKITTKFENGIEATRSTATVSKSAFDLTWTSMKESDYQLLKAFFLSQGARPFNWTDTATSTAYVVRFPISELESEHIYNGRRKVSIMLHEVPNA